MSSSSSSSSSSSPGPSLAIVGAGAAGLAAAFALRDAELAVTVFEKSRGLAGRAATRWRDAPDRNGVPFRWRYDHGAQYLSAPVGSPAHRLVTRDLDTAGQVEIGGGVWPFDDDGTLQPDQARPEGAPRLTWRDGVSTLGRLLVEATPGLEPVRETRVGRLEPVAVASGNPRRGWRLEDTEGAWLGCFDAVLFTSPSPQTLEVLASSGEALEPLLGGSLESGLATALEPAVYRSQYAVVLGFQGAAPRPEPYALVNPTGGHAIAWLAVESDKPGRAPDGATLLLAQMSPGWTREYFEADRDTVVHAAARAIGDLLGASLPQPAWSDTQRWRYALPNAGADREALAEAEATGLFFAGDSIVGKGRVHLALEDGLDVAERIRARFAS